MKDYDDAIAILYELRLQSLHQHAVWLKLHNVGAYCRNMSDKALDDVLNGDDLPWWKRMFGRR